MKILQLIIGIFLMTIASYAQTKLWGMTHGGGSNNMGVLFQYTPSANGYSVYVDFAGITNGGYPNGSLMQASDGKIYGMTQAGGINDYGVLFQYNLSNNTYTKKIDFDKFTTGGYPQGTLMQASNGKLYGVLEVGGLNDMGVLIQYDINTNVFSKKIDFDGTTNGKTPQGSLMQASDGKIYGMTESGGANDCGVLFQYNPTTNVIVKKVDFDGATKGRKPLGSLVQAVNGKLYGMTTYGGASDEGALFEYDPTTNIFIKKINFDFFMTGSNPMGSLLQASDGLLYGLTLSGGMNSSGVLFQYNPSTNAISKKIEFDGGIVNGGEPKGSLIQASNGMLYGMTYSGGVNNWGVLFEYNVNTSNYIKKIDFSTSNGGNPVFTNLVEISSIVGIKENIPSGSFFIYPNPNSGLFSIELNIKSKITITNSLGEIISAQLMESGRHPIDMQIQSAGLYFIKVANDEGEKVVKLIKG